jgi:hypothetical protein
MQILCAPTRHEIDHVHAREQWLEIGIMSIHSLRHIDRKRVLVWLLLACLFGAIAFAVRQLASYL